MIRDDFRMYNNFKPITVDQTRYILFFNQNENDIEKKLMEYPTFIRGAWLIDTTDFNEFVKTNRVYYIKKAGM
jgi:hypothetical protein